MRTLDKEWYEDSQHCCTAHILIPETREEIDVLLAGRGRDAQSTDFGTDENPNQFDTNAGTGRVCAIFADGEWRFGRLSFPEDRLYVQYTFRADVTWAAIAFKEPAST